jgi:hypothetical protein
VLGAGLREKSLVELCIISMLLVMKFQVHPLWKKKTHKADVKIRTNNESPS